MLEEFEDLDFGSAQLKARFIKTMKTLSKNPEKSIYGSSENRSEAKAIYRLLGNDSFNLDEVKRGHKASTIKRIKDIGGVVLAIQDTSSINYNGHKKTKDLGYCGDNVLGINLHTCLAVTPDGVTLGVLEQSSHTREQNKDPALPSEKRRRNIEDKESYRWLETMSKSAEGIPSDIKLLHICDREGDMYELFEKAFSTGQLFLIRVAQNRLTTDNAKIIDEIKSRRPQGFMKVRIPRNSRTNTKARETILDVSYCSFELKKPKALERNRKLQETVAVNVIYVKEKSDDLSIEPIEWILATNDPVNSIDDAREKIENYVQRWKIERFHYVLKSGCAVEKIQEREASKTVALLLMYSIISFFIMNLTYMARINPDAPCSILFDEDEWKVLYCAGNRTKTPPSEPYSIKDAVTYLGRIGAPKRAPSDGPPGLKTVWIGLSNLHLLLSYREILCV